MCLQACNNLQVWDVFRRTMNKIIQIIFILSIMLGIYYTNSSTPKPNHTTSAIQVGAVAETIPVEFVADGSGVIHR